MRKARQRGAAGKQRKRPQVWLSPDLRQVLRGRAAKPGKPRDLELADVVLGVSDRDAPVAVPHRAVPPVTPAQLPKPPQAPPPPKPKVAERPKPPPARALPKPPRFEPPKPPSLPDRPKPAKLVTKKPPKVNVAKPRKRRDAR